MKLSDRWRLSEEITARFSGDRNGLYEIESNTLLGYSVGKGVTLWAGYTHDPNHSGGDCRIMEHRARAGHVRQFRPVRLRQVQRTGADGAALARRPGRRRLAGAPLAQIYSSVPQGGKTALVLSTEPFLNLNRNSFQRTRGLDRVRSFTGISTPLTKNVTAAAGYLNQHVIVRHGPTMTIMSHPSR